jgi:hypothetical protein
MVAIDDFILVFVTQISQYKFNSQLHGRGYDTQAVLYVPDLQRQYR